MKFCSTSVLVFVLTWLPSYLFILLIEKSLRLKRFENPIEELSDGGFCFIYGITVGASVNSCFWLVGWKCTRLNWEGKNVHKGMFYCWVVNYIIIGSLKKISKIENILCKWFNHVCIRICSMFNLSEVKLKAKWVHIF